ncbi:hypothetical protein AB0H83_19800 [Dactylosporangium sp. NPDC050688]|uniref:hypothetical protein n=1 Tax=Dactylosporangium sp. NPDC050688 TaxID=3157217 RepID=UPI0033F76102
MDGHWEWSDSGEEPDTGDTADLSGDHGFEQTFEHGYGQGFDGHGFEPGHDEFGGDQLGAAAHGGDDLEEPLGTEHAAEAYDQSVHDGHTDGHTDGGGGFDPTADDTGTDPGDPGDLGVPGDLGHVDVDVDTVGQLDAFGSDPDVHGDDGWPEPQFPEQLHLDGPPEPVDGFPWTDAGVLGGPDPSLSAAYDPAGYTDGADPSDLAGYAGADVPAGPDPWGQLLSSEDPATSSLAGFWAPLT